MTTNEQVLEFLKNNPNSDKAAITAATTIKGIGLFNAIKSLQKDGLITTQGDGLTATFSAAVITEVKQQPIEPVVEETVQGADVSSDVQPLKEQPQQTIEETPTEKSTARDNSKFKLNGVEYNKGGLARAIISAYVADNPDTTYLQLQGIFKPELLKRFGVIQTIEEGRKISGPKYDRYFFKPDHVIVLKDKTPVVVSSQWTFENIQPLIKVAKSLGYKIK